MTYNPRSANPFVACDPNKEWTSNNLILQDVAMRERAGIRVLDDSVSEMFPCPAAAPAPQSGGGAKGAPFHLKNYGAKNVSPYEPQDQLGTAKTATPLDQVEAVDQAQPPAPAVQVQAPQVGGRPQHYFKNNSKW